MSRAADRFEPVEGRPLVPLPEFHLEERVVETLVHGVAPTWVVIPAFDEAGGWVVASPVTRPKAAPQIVQLTTRIVQYKGGKVVPVSEGFFNPLESSN